MRSELDAANLNIEVVCLPSLADQSVIWLTNNQVIENQGYDHAGEQVGWKWVLRDCTEYEHDYKMHWQELDKKWQLSKYQSARRHYYIYSPRGFGNELRTYGARAGSPLEQKLIEWLEEEAHNSNPFYERVDRATALSERGSQAGYPDFERVDDVAGLIERETFYHLEEIADEK